MNIPKKIQERTTTNEYTGCMVWTGGYDHPTTQKPVVYAPESRLATRNGRVRPHRWLYDLNVKSLALKEQISKKCGTKDCVNPTHYRIK